MEPCPEPILPREDSVPAFADMRGAQRFALLIRAAKLVCDSGEFLCVVRDVSATGLRLKLFHPLPPGDRMAIELANGEFYLVEKVWERDGFAGFRFAAAIDVRDFIDEPSRWPRRPIRVKIAIPAVLRVDGTVLSARIADLSQHGARIVCDHHLAVEQRVKLEAAGLPPLHANICWRSRPTYGLVFQQRFTLDQLALLTASLQLAPPAHPPQVASG